MIPIVLPSYNRATILPRTVDSVVCQDYRAWGLIIVDDSSTDGMSEYLLSLDDPRTSVYHHSQNRGVTAAKTTGLDHLRGDWLTVFDSDDDMMLEALSVMMDYASHTGATAITCNSMDSQTGRMMGIGATCDGRLAADEAARCRGEHWGVTKTSLLGDLRFDERLPGFEGVLWQKINCIARRYDVHRALRICHTEGADRVTVTAHYASLADKARVICELGEDRHYLHALRTLDPQGYRRTRLRVWVARPLTLVGVRLATAMIMPGPLRSVRVRVGAARPCAA